jgi:hypothetical protein
LEIGNRTFRATGITAYQENDGTIENAHAIAAHESPRTTKLYDPGCDRTSRNRANCALKKYRKTVYFRQYFCVNNRGNRLAYNLRAETCRYINKYGPVFRVPLRQPKSLKKQKNAKIFLIRLHKKFLQLGHAR